MEHATIGHKLQELVARFTFSETPQSLNLSLTPEESKVLSEQRQQENALINEGLIATKKQHNEDMLACKLKLDEDLMTVLQGDRENTANALHSIINASVKLGTKTTDESINYALERVKAIESGVSLPETKIMPVIDNAIDYNLLGFYRMRTKSSDSPSQE